MMKAFILCMVPHLALVKAKQYTGKSMGESVSKAE
jgi:hypothetical protein